MAGGYITLSYSTTSNGATSATVAISMYYYGNGVSHNEDTDMSQSITFNGSTQSFRHTFSTSTSAQLMGTKSWTVTKGHSSKSLTASGSMYTAVSLGTLTASCSVSISAQTSYTVSYNANGGSGAPGSQTKWYGETLTLSTTKPTKTGYTFAGWYTAASGGSKYGTTYTSNAAATLYAHWTANSYTLTYNANGGSVSPSTKAITYDSAYGTLATPTRGATGEYRFDGWFTSSTGGTQVTSSTVCKGNDTVYAHWTLLQYTITYDKNGGSGATMAPSTKQTQPITLSTNTYTKTGYTFIGWGTASNQTSPTYADEDEYSNNESVTLYALWKKTITLSYNVAGGSPTPATQTKNIYNSTTEATFTISSVVPTKQYYTFSTWKDTSDVSHNTNTSWTISDNSVLTANWTEVYTSPQFVVNPVTYRTNSTYTSNTGSGTYGVLVINYLNGMQGPTELNTSLTASYVNNAGDTVSLSFTKSKDSTTKIITATAHFGALSGDNALLEDRQYNITITLQDTNKPANSYKTFISTEQYVIDVNTDGTAIGLLQVAPDGQNGQDASGIYLGKDLYTKVDGANTAIITAGVAEDNLLLSTSTLNAWKTILGIS